MAELTLQSDNGGSLQIVADSNREYPDFIKWHTGPNAVFGVVTNSAKARRWLRSALRRLEKDAARRKRKANG